jgi:hypothetical protein
MPSHYQVYQSGFHTVSAGAFGFVERFIRGLNHFTGCVTDIFRFR